MRYKGEYSPSYLADPVRRVLVFSERILISCVQETYEWFPLATCAASLDTHRYACFSHPKHSIVGLPDELEGR